MKLKLITLILALRVCASADEIGGKKVYNCQYMKAPPYGVLAWADSDIVKTGKNRESRFVKYNSDAAKGLILDATTVRQAYVNDKVEGYETSFYMFYNEKGWYTYIQCEDPEIEKSVAADRDTALEIFFVPGMKDVPYYQMIVRQLQNNVTHYDWAMPHRDYRSLKGRARVEALPIKAGFGTFIFIPWDVVYERIPLNGDYWRFSFMRWGKPASMTWGGNVHDTGNFGLVKFEKPSADVKTAIEKEIINRAKITFRRAAGKAEKHWSDPIHGDADFYNSVLKPAIDWHTANGPKDLASVGKWMEFKYEAAEMRSEYLNKKRYNAPKAEVEANEHFSPYVVPAMSSVKRLPHKLPSDAVSSNQLKLVAAKGEYEPASFILRAHKDASKLTFKISDLKSTDGTIAASNIDLKIVKCWYQGGTAWYSYFGDSNRRELVPELLLNDENLVKVDTEKKENYLRVGGKYRWVSYPKKEAKEAFNYMTEPVADSKTLKPATLTKGRNKQFWVTVHVPKTAKAGLYRGTIAMSADGKRSGNMEIYLKVLPYELPVPRTYYDLDSEFLVTIYGVEYMKLCYDHKLDKDFMERQQLAIYKNVLAHNVRNVRQDQPYNKKEPKAAERIIHELRLMKKAGLQMKPLLSGNMVWLSPWYGDKNKEDLYRRMDELIDILVKELGHKDIYLTSWDEANTKRVLTMRELNTYINSKGIKMWATTHKGRHFNLAGHTIGYANHGGWPDREHADMWHAIGSKVASYAGPHTGPENPEVFRRWEGIARYKANYDGSFNYKLYSQLHPWLYKKHKSNVWNEFMGGSFRGFNMVYPTADGVIDTIAWEGFREGIDDIRYATKLKLLAAEAIKSGKYDAAHAAKKALIWLHLLDQQSCDMRAMRLEMIEYIDKISKALAR